jgi:G8 domain
MIDLRSSSVLPRRSASPIGTADLCARLACAATAVAGLLGGCGGSDGSSTAPSGASDTQQTLAASSGDSRTRSLARKAADEVIAKSLCTTTQPNTGALEPSAQRGASAASMAGAEAEDHVAMLAAMFDWNVVAVASGQWHNPSTWQRGRVPGDGDNVRIPPGISVRLVDRQPAALARVYVEGSLEFVESRDTRLIVDTMLVGTSGAVEIGSAEGPVQAGRTAELIIQSHRDAPLNVAERTRGIIASGQFTTNGPDKVNMAALFGDARKGSTTLRFKTVPAGWAVGDDVVVTGTYFHWADSQDQKLLENEVRKITAINGTTMTLDSALVYDHVKPETSFSIFVSNLTRSIVIRSANAQPLTERGHVMFMKGAKVDIRDAAFIDLGRTDKTLDLSDTNIRGVYSVHFHQNGYDDEQHIAESVVRGTPGWGLVNHSSNVVATNNVVHDFTGAGFSAEAGDEIGRFTGNIVSGGTQRPLQGKPYAREAIGEEPKRRLEAGDMGKFANGFWIVSPQVVIQNNVVAGGNGTAYLMFSLGTKEFGPDHPEGQFTGFPLDRVRGGVVPRTWNYPNQFTGATMAVTADLPIKDFKNNIAYGVFQGMRVRWTNDDAGFMYNANKGVDVQRFQITPPNLTRQRHLLSNLTFWNVGSGLNVGYSENYDVDNLTVINEPGYDPGCGERFCGAYGFSTDGGGGMDAQLRNSRFAGGSTSVFDLASEMSTINTFVDGKLYTEQ